MRRRKEVVAHVVRGSGGPLRPGINRVRVVGVLFEKGRPIVIVKDAAPPAPKPRRTHEQKVADQLAAQDPYCLTKAGCEQTRTRLLAFAKHLRQLAEALKNPLTRHGTLYRRLLEMLGGDAAATAALLDAFKPSQLSLPAGKSEDDA